MTARTDEGPIWHYPALVGCIGEARGCCPAELQRVATRILAEALHGRGSLAARRAALIAARIALDGDEG